MFPFFKFPSMRKLFGCQVEDVPDEPKNTPIVPTLGITEIALCCSGGTGDGLIHWIAACKALKTFSYDYGGSLTDAPFYTEPVVQSLLLQKATLESIHIRSSKDGPLEEEEWPKIESFAEFTVLKHLNISVDDLVEITTPKGLRDALPSSLETLHLDCLDEELFHETVRQLEELVTWRYMPKLASLTIEACQRPRIPDGALRAELEGLTTRCQEAGISLHAIKGKGEDPHAIQLVPDPDQPGVVAQTASVGQVSCVSLTARSTSNEIEDDVGNFYHGKKPT